MGELLTEHDGDGGVDGEGSGGQSPSRQGARTGPSDPRNLFWMAAELGVVFCKILRGLGFSPRGQFMVQRATSGGAPGGHTTPRRGLGFSWPSRLVGPAQATYDVRFGQIRCLFRST